MARSRKQLRQNAGGNVGIIFKGTATASAAETQLDDTSQDSELDPGDNAQRLNGAGILVDNTTNLFYRQNITYVPASQRISWTGAISGLGGTEDYEVHLEPLLHPLTVWPRLIDDALVLIRRLAFQRILFANRGYYDLSDYGDIVGSEQIRRAYVLSPNLLQNDDFATWATGEDGPGDWTASAALTRVEVRNYPQAALLNSGETLLQDLNLGIKGRRLRIGVWCTTALGSTATLRVTARLSDDSTEREVTATLAAGLTRQIEAEIETTARTNSIRVTLEAAGGDCTFWAPFAYELSRGRRRRIKPLSVLNVGGPTGSEASMRMEVPARTQGVGELALLLPYPTLGSVATNAADIVTTAAPDDLIEAAVTKRVLDWLVHHPQIPARSKEEYGRALIRWEATFLNKARLHMRKIAKTQELWESGELN